MADKVRKIAVEIANELFTNGSGEHAKHLNLIMDGGRYVGGWCEAAVADIIERKIRASQQNMHPTYGESAPPMQWTTPEDFTPPVVRLVPPFCG